MLKKLFTGISFLLILLLSALLIIAGGSNTSSAVPSEQALNTIGSLSDNNPSALAAHFGAPVPYVLPTGSGRVEDTAYAGGYARKFMFNDRSGTIITAVRPAAAAPLLNPGGLSFDASQVYTIGDMHAVMATDNNGTYLYFSNEIASYCIYTPSSPSAMDALLYNLQFTD